MKISEEPEKWIILRMPDEVYKVFGSWAGGYLGGDRWKINSGISKVESNDDYYYFYGHSGSCYKCHKGEYGTIAFYNKATLANIIKMAEGQITILDNQDWSKSIDLWE